MEWDESLTTGNELIDSQHKVLFERMNEFKRAMELGVGREEVGEVIAFLEGYITAHFAVEETFMDERGYPNRATHKEEHASFIRDFEEFKREFHERDPSQFFAIKTHGWLTGWLSDHIAQTDMALGRFLKATS
ncbi:MAG: bacteriohemerythrin [Thermodesulfobacteriota bacterium]